MASATVSYRTEFESSYIQDAELHSHRYRLEVAVDGPQRYKDCGRVIDFKSLSNYVNQITYSKQYLVGADASPHELAVADAMKVCGISVHTFDTVLSVEHFCKDIAERLQVLLNKYEPGVRVIEVKLRENNDSFATWSI